MYNQLIRLSNLCPMFYYQKSIPYNWLNKICQIFGLIWRVLPLVDEIQPGRRTLQKRSISIGYYSMILLIASLT